MPSSFLALEGLELDENRLLKKLPLEAEAVCRRRRGGLGGGDANRLAAAGAHRCSVGDGVRTAGRGRDRVAGDQRRVGEFGDPRRPHGGRNGAGQRGGRIGGRRDADLVALHRGDEHRVHAAVGVGRDRRRGDAAADQLRDLVFVVALLLLDRGDDLVGHLEDRALAGGAERQRPRSDRSAILRVEHVALLADVDLGLEPRDLEMVVAPLEHLPERHVRVVAMLGEILRRHAERIGLHLEGALAAEERLAAERVDFRDLLVGHRVAAARRAVAVHHQVRAGAAVRAVDRRSDSRGRTTR